MRPAATHHIHKRIVILGGGIGGCSAAHRLIMAGVRGSDILILERNVCIGGIARSGRIPKTGLDGRKDLATEASWRVEGSDYVVVDSILSDIPDPDPDTVSNNNKRTTRDNFTYTSDPYWMTMSSGKSSRVNSNVQSFMTYVKNFSGQLSTSENIHLLDRLLYGLMCSKKRRNDELSEVTWRQFLSPVAVAAEPYVIRPTAPIFGVDAYKTSASSVLEYLEHWATPEDHALGLKNTTVSNRPTNEAWFTPWRKWLESKGVLIWTSTHITKMSESSVRDENGISSKQLSHVDCFKDTTDPTVADATGDGEDITNAKTTMQSYRVYGKWFVCALPIEVACVLLPRTYPQVESFSTLSRLSLQDMVGMQIYFDQPVTFPQPRTGILMLDSPWQLIIESQGVFWSDLNDPNTIETDIKDHYGDGKTSDIWTITLCDQHRPGGLHKKPWLQCTKREICEEVWHQLISSKSITGSCRGKHDNRPFAQMGVNRFHVWDTWYTRRSDGKMACTQPKTSPNAKTKRLRPTTQSAYNNMMFGAVWAQSPKEMHRMETAASNGFAAAEAIISKENLIPEYMGYGESASVIHHRDDPPRAFPLLLAPIRAVDTIFATLGLPHPSRMCCGLSTTLFFIIYVLLLLFLVVGFGSRIFKSI